MVKSILRNSRILAKQHVYTAVSFLNGSHARQRSSRQLTCATTNSSEYTQIPKREGLSLSTYSADACIYTNGRWLHNDKLEHESRYIEFDFKALCARVVALCPGARSIVGGDKKEGGYNRVFIFTLDNERRVVARLPTPISGPPRLKTKSEVATITYLQANTTVPIPKILDWNDSSENDVGAEYIIMEHAKGVQLHQKWPEMPVEQQIACTGAVVMYLKQLADLQFSAYGSLYFDSVEINPALKQPLSPGYIVGPHCGPTYWDCDVREPRYYHGVEPNRGPWLDISAYCSALFDVGISRLPPSASSEARRPDYWGAVHEHDDLLGVGRDVARKLILDPRVCAAAAPTLLHPDLHKRNIYVEDGDPTCVTGFIDWQSTSISPGFAFANEIPDFATPQNQAELEESASPPASPTTTAEGLCGEAYRAGVGLLIPKVYAARLLDDNILGLFEYCHRTYRDGAAVLRQLLMNLSTNWKELELQDTCPYQLPSPEQLLSHEKELKALENARELKHFVMSRLNTASDGWVPSDAWEATKEEHRQLYNEFLQTMDEKDLRKVWPFDAP